ncbi:MAG: transporter substrate-binding protein, partial [Clostridia bacterium]|nr:transporter substrate-binding protein [Clostridia bacterium]
MNAVACSKIQTSNEGTTSIKAETKVSDQPIEIEFWYGLGGVLGENMQKIVDDFNSSQTNIIVKTAVQGDYEETMQKLQAAFADGNVPEVVVLNSERADGIARNGMAYSFQPFIDEDPAFNIDDLVSAFRNQGTYNNELVTIPAYGTTDLCRMGTHVGRLQYDGCCICSRRSSDF